MNKYEKLRNEILDWEKHKGVVMMKDIDDLHKRKVKAFISGEITEKQAITLEKRIDKLL
jgi:hypothetical protein